MTDYFLLVSGVIMISILLGLPWAIHDYTSRDKRKDDTYSGKYTSEGKQVD